MNKKKGLLIVFSGPSGAGKGTVLAEFWKNNENVKYSVSATTRKPRPGEVDGVHYHFVSREAFEEMIAKDEIVEYTEYNGNYYGSPAAPIRKLNEEGFDVLLEIEVDGARQVKEKFPDALSIFILPPSFEELARRLTGRNTETEEEIARRLDTAKKEIALAYEYDYVIVNDEVEKAAEKLSAVITAAKFSKKFNREIIEEVL